MDVWVAVTFHISHRKTLNNTRKSNVEEILQTDTWLAIIYIIYIYIFIYVIYNIYTILYIILHIYTYIMNKKPVCLCVAQ